MPSFSLLLLLVLVFLHISYYFSGQGQDEPQIDEAQFREPTGDYQPEFTEEQQRAMIEAQKAKLWGCYFLTKSKIFSKSDNMGKLFSGKNGEALFKRISTDLMKNCLNTIQPEDSERVRTYFLFY